MEHQAREVLEAIHKNMMRVVVGKEEAVNLVLCAMLAGGHVLIEDVPGLGKTTMVTALARSVDCTFSRIQFTPDVLPADVTGFTLFNLHTGEKEIHHGGVMAQIVMADEINRASPKTQSSLLEAMQENQVTIDGVTYPLPRPFMVLATQNPVELTGTYPLPEAQLDRFLMRISMGYPGRRDEVEILSRNRAGQQASALTPVASAQDVLMLHEAHAAINCAQSVMDYIVSIAAATRVHPMVALGVSPRGSLSLMQAAAAYALLQGREFVLPDDVQYMAPHVLGHRILLHPQASFKNITALALLGEIIKGIRVPDAS